MLELQLLESCMLTCHQIMLSSIDFGNFSGPDSLSSDNIRCWQTIYSAIKLFNKYIQTYKSIPHRPTTYHYILMRKTTFSNIMS